MQTDVIEIRKDNVTETVEKQGEKCVNDDVLLPKY